MTFMLAPRTFSLAPQWPSHFFNSRITTDYSVVLCSTLLETSEAFYKFESTDWHEVKVAYKCHQV